nr:immunoglobulin heavy chain junction region [Mus musculus]
CARGGDGNYGIFWYFDVW